MYWPYFDVIFQKTYCKKSIDFLFYLEDPILQKNFHIRGCG